MAEEQFTIELTRDQAFVLSDWLDRVIGTAEFDALTAQDPAVRSPLFAIAGALDKSLVEIFMPDYNSRLDTARARLLAAYGEVDPPENAPDNTP